MGRIASHRGARAHDSVQYISYFREREAHCDAGIRPLSARSSAHWPDPSFTGGYLPVARAIQRDGFQAEWKILHLARNFPQHWSGGKYKIVQAAFGVNLLIPVDAYQKSMRSAKYAIMFISLTFLAFFVIELLNRTPLHPIQYLFIGFALLLFYTLLLSLSEHIQFGAAYAFAALCTILMIAVYTHWVLLRKRIAMLIATILALFYSTLYVILQLQDYALIVGSGLLFIILFTVMYLTRSINWFEVFKFSKREIGK